MGALKPLETGAPIEPSMGLGEGKAAMVVPCTGAGRAVLAKDRLFKDVMFRRLLVRSLVCNIKWGKNGVFVVTSHMCLCTQTF